MKVHPGDIISHTEMCMLEGVSLQRGMNYRIKGGDTVILMSIRKKEPHYADRVEDNGQTLIYEGHDVTKNLASNPKAVDQPRYTPKGTLTANGHFFKTAINFKESKGIC
jgi:hypothetical protein